MSQLFYDAFISYSTQDSEFVTALRLALEVNGRRVWQDVKELELTAEWWAQIRQGIAVADNFLFVVSPRSMASPICHLELEHARTLNKRVLIIRFQVANKTDSTRAMIERILTQDYLRLLTAGRDMFGLAEANWALVEAEQAMTIAEKDDLAAKVPRLIEAFDKDLLYIRQGNLLLGRAREWAESGHSASFLLSGEALSAAERWRNAGKQPPPTPDHHDYIAASRAAEDARLDQLRELEAQRRAAESAVEQAALSLDQTQRKLRAEQRAGAITAGFGGLVIGLAVMATVFALGLLDGVQGQVRAASAQLSAVPPTLRVISTQIAAAQARSTQSALNATIIDGFANIVLQQRDDPNAQIVAMNALVERYPDQAQAYIVRGLTWAAQGEHRRAIADFDRALDVGPADGTIYYNRGTSYLHLDDYERAIADFSQAIAYTPGYISAYLNRAIANTRRGSYQRAWVDFDRIIELDPTEYRAYNGRAYVFFELGDTAKAFADIDAAIALRPDHPGLYDSRCELYFKSGQWARGLADCDRAAN